MRFSIELSLDSVLQTAAETKLFPGTRQGCWCDRTKLFHFQVRCPRPNCKNVGIRTNLFYGIIYFSV